MGKYGDRAILNHSRSSVCFTRRCVVFAKSYLASTVVGARAQLVEPLMGFGVRRGSRVRLHLLRDTGQTWWRVGPGQPSTMPWEAEAWRTSSVVIHVSIISVNLSTQLLSINDFLR
jgi:hypothetical protein